MSQLPENRIDTAPAKPEGLAGREKPKGRSLRVRLKEKSLYRPTLILVFWAVLAYGLLSGFDVKVTEGTKPAPWVAALAVGFAGGLLLVNAAPDAPSERAWVRDVFKECAAALTFLTATLLVAPDEPRLSWAGLALSPILLVILLFLAELAFPKASGAPLDRLWDPVR